MQAPPDTMLLERTVADVLSRGKSKCLVSSSALSLSARVVFDREQVLRSVIFMFLSSAKEGIIARILTWSGRAGGLYHGPCGARHGRVPGAELHRDVFLPRPPWLGYGCRSGRRVQKS